MRNDKTKEPLLSDERIFDRVNEYTLPYRTEITRVTKEFRDIYEQARKQDKERIRELQAFKDYVHQRLDEAGIPTHPPGEHMDAGGPLWKCRMCRHKFHHPAPAQPSTHN